MAEIHEHDPEDCRRIMPFVEQFLQKNNYDGTMICAKQTFTWDDTEAIFVADETQEEVVYCGLRECPEDEATHFVYSEIWEQMKEACREYLNEN